MGNRIELAKSARSKCVTCDAVIPKGGVRLAEETRDIGIPDLIHRFYHLECAAAVHPELVANALQTVDSGVVFDRAKIEAKIRPAIERATEARKQKYLAQKAEKEAKTKSYVVEADETTNELFSQLDGNPEDPGTLAVVADQLQARGDVRGELIALQLGSPSTAFSLEGDDDEETDHAELTSDAERRSRRCTELMEKLGIPLDPGDKCVWGVGFIRRLELLDKSGTRLEALAAIWKHPSLRFLSELELRLSSIVEEGFAARLVELIPRTLRRLEINGGMPVGALVAQLPKLESLVISGRIGHQPLVHPTLRRLEIGSRGGATDVQNTLPRLVPKQLPALVDITILPGATLMGEMWMADTFAGACASLGGNKWFKQLTHFAWHGAERALTDDDVAALTGQLGKKGKLARLDLTGTQVPLALRDKLMKLCDELVVPNLVVPDDATIYVEHTAKPEWGRGKLVRRHEGKVEVEFKKPVGKKVFKADAPFLKLHA